MPIAFKREERVVGLMPSNWSDGWVWPRKTALADRKNLNEQTNTKQQIESYAQNQNCPRSRKPQSGFTKGMAGRSQEAFGERKEVLETARRIEPPTPQAALGQNRETIRFLWADGQGDARRFVRRQEPAYCLSLHVRAGLGGRLRALLVLGRPFRQRKHSHWTARHGFRRGFPRAPGGNRAVQAAHGLEVQLGFLVQHRFQF